MLHLHGGALPQSKTGNKFMDFCAETSVLVSVPLIYLTLMTCASKLIKILCSVTRCLHELGDRRGDRSRDRSPRSIASCKHAIKFYVIFSHYVMSCTAFLLSSLPSPTVCYFIQLIDMDLHVCDYYGRPMPCGFFFFFYLFFSPNLSRRRLDVYYTSTHGLALVRI